MRRQNQPARLGQSTWDEFDIEKTGGVYRPGHEQLALRQFLETNTRILGRIPHQNDQPVALCLGTGQTFLHEG
jgi:hypothetical protein